MKKFIVIAAVAGVISLSAGAQTMPERKNDGVNNERTEKRGDVYKDLNLTKDQQQKLKALREGSRSQMEAIRNDNSLTQEQKKARFDAYREDQKTKMNAILTPEQRAKMDAKMLEMKNNRGQRDWKKSGENRGVRKGGEQGKKEGWKKDNSTDKDRNGLNRAGNRRGADWMNDLNLTTDQKNQMKTLNEESRGKMQTIRDNSSLTQDQKKGRMQELMKETQTKRKSILTAEQWSKWQMKEQQMRTQRPQRAGNSQSKI